MPAPEWDRKKDHHGDTEVTGSEEWRASRAQSLSSPVTSLPPWCPLSPLRQPTCEDVGLAARPGDIGGGILREQQAPRQQRGRRSFHRRNEAGFAG